MVEFAFNPAAHVHVKFPAISFYFPGPDMGCRMTVSQDVPDEYPEIPNLLSLPDEVLVKIMSFLPDSRDRVKLRYVSRRLLRISETPSLWAVFVWPDCNLREEKSLHNVMKACGVHIRRLSFPTSAFVPIVSSIFAQNTQKTVRMSGMAKMLQYCRNLTHLSLGHLNSHSDGSDKRVREAIQEMNHLEMLDICCYGSLQPYLNLKVALKELTIHTVISSLENTQAFKNWMTNGFNPRKLNIIVFNGSMDSTMIRFREFLLFCWPRWNSQIPAGHVACLRLYVSYKAPLSLFENVPVFQLRYGETATCPFVQPSNLGVTWFLLTDNDVDGKMIHKARVYWNAPPAMLRYNDFWLDSQTQLGNYMTNLTELDLSGHNLDFKRIVADCPQLQRLNLRNNRSLRIEDLQLIATCCYNLRGLNLMEILITDIKFCLKVWKILSSMRLTHLSMDASFIDCSLIIYDVHRQQLVALFERSTTLQALNLFDSEVVYQNFRKAKSYDCKLLSHFRSLEYCRLTICNREPTCVLDILTTCKKLKTFCYISSTQLSRLLPAHNNLQQLCISSKYIDLDDNFMDMVSVHGGLIHVALFVGSVTCEGVTILIRNSPSLLTFGLCEQRREQNYRESLNRWLSKKFPGRKLFTSGLFCLIQQTEEVNCNEWLQNTDLLPLWPPDHFPDLQIRHRDTLIR